MENEKQCPYGSLIAGSGTSDQREIPIAAYFSGEYLDGRTVTVAELESGEGYVLYAQNDIGTIRNPESSMWLSEDTFIAMISSALFFCQKRGYDFEAMLNKIVTDGKLQYGCSDNLKA